MAGWILNPPSPADCFPISCIATCLVPFVFVSDLGLNLPAEVFVSESDCIETLKQPFVQRDIGLLQKGDRRIE